MMYTRVKYALHNTVGLHSFHKSDDVNITSHILESIAITNESFIIMNNHILLLYNK